MDSVFLTEHAFYVGRDCAQLSPAVTHHPCDAWHNFFEQFHSQHCCGFPLAYLQGGPLSLFLSCSVLSSIIAQVLNETLPEYQNYVSWVCFEDIKALKLITVRMLVISGEKEPRELGSS